jgi:DNA-binding response OmpR family regulator
VVTPALILVVDDDWMNRELMEAVLNSAGYVVALASSIQKAMEMAEMTVPDLALVDVRLQGENDGYLICQQLKNNARTAHTKVVMLTALEDEEARQRAFESGADDFITRFTDMSILLERIETLLKQ